MKKNSMSLPTPFPFLNLKS